MLSLSRNVCAGPDRPPAPPAAALRARIARLKGVTVTSVARRLKYSRCWVESVINERDDSERLRRKVAELLDTIEAERFGTDARQEREVTA